MAGILDKKTRFIDLVITNEGKRQLASGKMKAEYFSLTDMHVAYEKGDTHDEVSKRLYFEVQERLENRITLENDDSGLLVNYQFSPTGSIIGNKIFEQNAQNENIHAIKLQTGSQFASLSEELPKVFPKNFKKNYLIGSVSEEESKFEIDTKKINFKINENLFLGGTRNKTINVNNAETFILDPMLAHKPNFQYLPPINTDGSSFGQYTDLRNTTELEWEDILNRIGNDVFAQEAYEINNVGNEYDINNFLNRVGQHQLLDPIDPQIIGNYRDSQTINFIKTSKGNNIAVQFYEKANDSIKKLDVIDAGVFTVDNDINGLNEKHVFYVGKVFFDNYNTPTFINLFTIVFD